MSNNLLRVTQLDAIQLDNEIAKILKSMFEDATKYLPPGSVVPFEPEINLLIRLFTLYYSVIKNGATFGQQLLLIKYNNLTPTKKFLYVLFSSLPYIKERCELWRPGNKINRVFSAIEGLIVISSFINLSCFLRSGSKPSMVDKVLGLEQVYAKNTAPRQFENKYLTRELLWHGFIELLLFLMPLINLHKIKRMARNMSLFNKRPKAQKSEVRIYNNYSKCPHCLESPIQPHHMGCVHAFCYICLKSNQLADPKYECPLCGYNDTICERVNMM